MDPTIQNISQQTEVPVSQIPQTPQGPAASVSAPPSPKKSHKMPMLLMALFVIFVIAAFFAGTYYQGMNKQKEVVQVQPSPTAIAPSPTVDPTTDWKTYTDSKNGFSIKYPSTLRQVTIGTGAVALSPSVPSPFYSQATFALPGVTIDIRSDNSESLTSSEYVQQKIIPQNDYTKDARIIRRLSGVDGVLADGFINPVSDEPAGPTAYIIRGTSAVSIDFDSTGISDKTIFDQILTTFRFFDPESSPSGTN